MAEKRQYKFEGPVLSVQGLEVAYGGKTIIKDINITINDVVFTDPGSKPIGQKIAFVGRSGRGKSTYFRAITGLVRPTAGSVLIPELSDNDADGKQLARSVEAGDIGFVDQKYSLFRHLTAFENCNLALRKVSLPDKEKKVMIDKYLTTWGLDRQRNQYPDDLSGGQRQRLAIIMQLLCSCHQSYVLVMDEPFSGLDVKNVEDVKRTIKLVNNVSEENTIIFSTHDIELAVEQADIVYVIGHPKLEDGSLADYGTILAKFDLMEMGLAWSDTLTAEHLTVVQQIKQVMFDS